MATPARQTMTPSQIMGWAMLASYVQFRQGLSWLWLTDELVIMSIISTKGNDLGQEVCWETIAVLDYDHGRA